MKGIRLDIGSYWRKNKNPTTFNLSKLHNINKCLAVVWVSNLKNLGILNITSIFSYHKILCGLIKLFHDHKKKTVKTSFACFEFKSIIPKWTHLFFLYTILKNEPDIADKIWIWCVSLRAEYHLSLALRSVYLGVLSKSPACSWRDSRWYLKHLAPKEYSVKCFWYFI